MDKHDLDAVVASTPENVLYATDVFSNLQWVGYYHSNLFAIIPRDKDPAIVTTRQTMGALEQSWIKSLYFYGQPVLGIFVTAQGKSVIPFEDKPVHENETTALISALKDRSLEESKVGFDNLGQSLHEKLKKALPKANLTEDSVLLETRLVKTEEEISRMKKVTSATELAIGTAIKSIKDGITDREVREIAGSTMVKAGAVPVTLIARGGPLSSKDLDYRHRYTAPHVMKRGDLLWFDVAARAEGYRSDIGRTVVLGEPSDKVRKYYRAIRAGCDETLDALHPGVRACDLWNIANKTVQKQGIPHFMRTEVGHGLGLGFDPPNLEPKDQTELEEGMVINVETPYREIGFGGMMVEDTVVVKKNGFEFISTSNRDLNVA